MDIGSFNKNMKKLHKDKHHIYLPKIDLAVIFTINDLLYSLSGPTVINNNKKYTTKLRGREKKRTFDNCVVIQS